MAWRLKYNVSFPVTFADVLDNDFFSSSGDYITFIQNWEKTFPIRVTNDKGVDTNPAVNLMSYFTAYVYFSILQTFYFDRHKLLQKENTNYFFFFPP